MYDVEIPLYLNQAKSLRKFVQSTLDLSWEELALMTDSEVKESITSLGYTFVKTLSVGDDTLYIVPKTMLENVYALTR